MTRNTLATAVVAVAITIVSAIGCAWAPLTEGGEQVQFANQKAVESCRQIGTTNARTKSSMWIFARDEATVRDELRSLARNDAAVMGGTTVAPLGPVEDGQQSFGIYICEG